MIFLFLILSCNNIDKSSKASFGKAKEEEKSLSFEELVLAVKEGNNTKALTLLENFKDLNKEYEGKTLLELADEFNKDKNKEVRKAIRQKGKALNIALVDPKINTISILLADIGNNNKDENDTFLITLKKEIDKMAEIGSINNIDKYGETVLMKAIRFNNVSVTKYILDKDVNINQADKKGFTAIFFAMNQDSLEITNLLIAKGADLKIRSEDGTTLLMQALNKFQSHKIYFIENLLQSIDVNLQNSDGKTALMMACHLSEVDLVKLFLEKNANVGIKDKKGQTALMYASMVSNSEIINLLLENKANIDDLDIEGQSTLVREIYAENFNTAILLINRSANVDLFPKNLEIKSTLELAKSILQAKESEKESASNKAEIQSEIDKLKKLINLIQKKSSH